MIVNFITKDKFVTVSDPKHIPVAGEAVALFSEQTSIEGYVKSVETIYNVENRAEIVTIFIEEGDVFNDSEEDGDEIIGILDEVITSIDACHVRGKRIHELDLRYSRARKAALEVLGRDIDD